MTTTHSYKEPCQGRGGAEREATCAGGGDDGSATRGEGVFGEEEPVRVWLRLFQLAITDIREELTAIMMQVKGTSPTAIQGRRAA